MLVEFYSCVNFHGHNASSACIFKIVKHSDLLSVHSTHAGLALRALIAHAQQILCFNHWPWFPHGLEKWENFFQSGKSQEIFNRLEKSGNFTQDTGKIREFCSKYWENEGILSNFIWFFLWLFISNVLHK